MSGITELHRALVARVLDGEGKTPPEVRRAAFDNVGLGEPMRTLLLLSTTRLELCCRPNREHSPPQGFAPLQHAPLRVNQLQHNGGHLESS
jgi:hypothetical protein